MPTYEVDVDKKTYEVDAPDESTAWHWANETHRNELANAGSLSHLGSVALNAPYKGVANAIDAVLNTPTNIANLGIAAYGLGKGLIGSKNLPEPFEQPNYARHGLESLGLIRKEVSPITPVERIADVVGQSAAGAAFSPGSTVQNITRNALAGALAGGAGQLTTEATGSPFAGQVASLVTPSAVGKASNVLQANIVQRAGQEAANAERTANTIRGMQAGYVLPPTVNRPTLISRALESLGGKAATRQQAELQNQEVTNRLIREDLGLAENQPITEKALNDLRAKFGSPYKEISELAPKTTFSRDLISSSTDYPKQLIEDLKSARSDMRDWYKSYGRTADPDALKKARAFEAQAENLENRIDKIAIDSGKPDLIDRLREARRNIAKTYTVENALNVGSTNVDARAIGRELDKGTPLTGNMRDIGMFAEANPNFVRESAGVPTPGVSLGDVAGSTAAIATGHSIAGGIPLLRGPARALILSQPYQSMFARPDYSPSAIAKMLSKYNPSQEDINAMRAALFAQSQQ